MKINVGVSVYLIKNVIIILYPSNCKCEYEKRAAHLLTEECEVIIDDKTVPIKKYNKTVSIKKHNKYLNNSLDSCKPFVASSVFYFY